MAKLKNVHNIVLKLLQENEELRSDDFMLLSAVYGLQVAVDQLPFSTICQHHVDLGLPSFETVRRTRQKVQSQHPELVDEKMKVIRAAEQDEFHDYSKKSAEELEALGFTVIDDDDDDSYIDSDIDDDY